MNFRIVDKMKHGIICEERHIKIMVIKGLIQNIEKKYKTI